MYTYAYIYFSTNIVVLYIRHIAVALRLCGSIFSKLNYLHSLCLDRMKRMCDFLDYRMIFSYQSILCVFFGVVADAINAYVIAAKVEGK